MGGVQTTNLDIIDDFLKEIKIEDIENIGFKVLKKQLEILLETFVSDSKKTDFKNFYIQYKERELSEAVEQSENKYVTEMVDKKTNKTNKNVKSTTEKKAPELIHIKFCRTIATLIKMRIHDSHFDIYVLILDIMNVLCREIEFVMIFFEHSLETIINLFNNNFKFHYIFYSKTGIIYHN